MGSVGAAPTVSTQRCCWRGSGCWGGSHLLWSWCRGASAPVLGRGNSAAGRSWVLRKEGGMSGGSGLVLALGTPGPPESSPCVLWLTLEGAEDDRRGVLGVSPAFGCCCHLLALWHFLCILQVGMWARAVNPAPLSHCPHVPPSCCACVPLSLHPHTSACLSLFLPLGILLSVPPSHPCIHLSLPPCLPSHPSDPLSLHPRIHPSVLTSLCP